MATAVFNAVFSGSSEHANMFMSVVGTLHTKLTNYLQANWSKHAYFLQRIPTLEEFDGWINTIMGAVLIFPLQAAPVVAVNHLTTKPAATVNRAEALITVRVVAELFWITPLNPTHLLEWQRLTLVLPSVPKTIALSCILH